MTVLLSPVGGVAAQFFDNNGNPLSGGKLFSYAAGTTTPAATYTSSLGTTAHTNPIILDAGGRVPSGEIWLTDGVIYKFVLQTSTNVLIATYDNIVGINSNFVNYTTEQEIQTATAGQTVFNLTTTQYQPGTNSLSVYVDGVNQYGPGAQYAYLETDSNTVTFVSGLHVGASVKFTTATQTTGNATDASVVTYDPPFTGGVPTNVEAKLAQYVSVIDFGADPTGVADSTDEFNAALAASDNVFAPVGIYRLDASVTIPTGKSLEFGAGSVINFSSTTDNLFIVERGSSLIGNDSSINITSASSTKVAIYLNGQQWFLNTTPTLIGGFAIFGVSTVNNIGMLLDTTLAPVLANTGISFVRFYDMSFDNLNIGLFLSSGNLITQYINANTFTNFFFNRTIVCVSANATAPSEIAGNSFINFQIQAYGEVVPTNPQLLLNGAVNRNFFYGLQLWDWIGLGSRFTINAGSGNFIQSNVLYSQITGAINQVIVDLSGNIGVPDASLGINLGQQRFGQSAVAYSANERVTIASTVLGLGMNIQGGGASLGIGMYGGQASGATNANALEFQNNSSVVVGSVKFNGTTTTYATASDYRLKENPRPMTGQLERLMLLKPVVFDWKDQNTTGEGFIAHELQAVFPSAVTGEKDAVSLVVVRDEEGNIVGEKEAPSYQGVDLSHIVGSLVAALQELKTEFDAYKASHS
jgi:hypothetical protein